MAGEIERNQKQQAQFYFPILSKLLFASQHLSVQVHPDDSYALAREGGPGKTEMWYIVDAKPGAQLVLGLKRTMTPVELCRAAASGDIETYLNWVPVQKGQTLFISPGTLHTIGAGIVICEIQQNSDLTYRFYDFGRLDSDGKPRALHIEQAAAVTRQAPHPGALAPFRFPGPAAGPEGAQRELLAACRYFATERLSWSGPVPYAPDPSRFHLLIFLEGRGTLAGDTWDQAPYQAGDAYLIPAECAPFGLRAASPSLAIRSYVPELPKLRRELESAGASREQLDLLFTD
jgi:mannose-6-phosphate isomerase